MIKSMKEAKFKALGQKAADNAVVIEGYANRFLSDAYNERMDPLSVKLERYKQNPILLFNHDMNYPVGKVIAVEPREDGLFVKAAVSHADHEKVAYVRELVADGTLCTFSVRFAGEQVVEDPEVAGGKLIKNWELQEVSIVSIPAQPDSTFSLANAKSLGEARQMVLKAKGAMVAQVAAEHIAKLEEAGEKKEDLLEKISEQSGSEPGQLAEVLAGNVTPVPEPVLSALASVLGIDASVLAEHNAHDVEAQKKMDAEKPEEKMEDKPEEKKEDEKAEYPPLSQAVQECVSEKIPKLIQEGKEQEQAVAIAISMCSKEKGCSEFQPTREMMAKWLDDCDKVKQAEQEGTPQESVAVPNKEPEGMNDNALLMLMKSQLEMLGAISVKLDKLAEVFMAAAEKPKVEVEVEKEEPEAEMPAEAAEQMKAILDRYEAKLKGLLA
jgi:HK97 family phage prohead protease